MQTVTLSKMRRSPQGERGLKPLYDLLGLTWHEVAPRKGSVG